MKKIFILLSVFVLLILSTNVFAQELRSDVLDTEIEPVMPNQYVLPKVPDNFVLKSKTGSDAESLIVPTQATLGAYREGEPASCFDYYTFGSIGINLLTDTSTYNPGEPVVIEGQITNNNKFPITNLTVRARLVKNTPSPEYLRSEIMTLEDFNIVENISLNAGESFDIKYTHLLPINAPKGDYQVFFYAYNNDRFNQSGLSFTNDIIASQLNFSVGGTKQNHIYLDQTRITLNDQVHNVMAFMTQHEKETSINISIPLVNPSSEEEVMSVTYKLYKWDGLREENLVDTKTETVTIPANTTKQLTYTASNTDTSVYFLNIRADNQTPKKDKSVYNVQTQSNIRFVVEGYDFPRINSFGVNTYPIRAGQETTLFTCYHNGSPKDTLNPVNISTTLYDDKGKEITKTEYEGKITGDIEAIVKKFTIKKDLVNYKTVTIITDNKGNTIDKIENEYKCSELDPTLCPVETNYLWAGMFLGLLTLIVIIAIFKKFKNKMNIPTVMFVLAVLILPMVGGQKAEGAVVSSAFSMKVDCTENLQNNPCKKSQDGLLTFWIKGNMSGSFQKTFNFVKNGINLSDTTVNTLNIGETFSAETEATVGGWFYSGGYADSPPMDGNAYLSSDSWLYVSKPKDSSEVSIVSANDDIVSCKNNNCLVKNPGTTNIRVSFPVSTQVNNYDIGYARGYTEGYGQVVSGIYDVLSLNKDATYNWHWLYKYHTYAFPDIVYTITVPGVVNTPQISSCTGVTNVSATGATLNWNYSDTDNDPQTNYQIQVATDAAFTDIVKSIVAPSNTDVSSIRSASVSGLLPNTTYYAQVRTYNNTNSWSTYSSCGDEFTTLNEPINGACGTALNTCTSPEPATNTSVSGSISSWSCPGSNGGSDDDTCKVDNGGGETFSCSVPPVTKGSPSIHTAKPDNATSYKWKDIDGLLLGSNQIYSFTYGTTGPHDIEVEITKNGITKTETCTAQVNCPPPIVDNCDTGDSTHSVAILCNPNGTWVYKDMACGSPEVTPSNPVEFYFSPNIAGSDGKCPFYLKVTGVTACELHNRLGALSSAPFNAINGTVNVPLSTERANIGTHTVWCTTSTEPTPIQFGTAKSCFSESNVRED